MARIWKNEFFSICLQQNKEKEMKKLIILTLCLSGLLSCIKKRPSGSTAMSENDKVEATIAVNNENRESILNEAPQLAAQENLLDAILAKYKGKVVLVDFWATWCGPCMTAMKSILPMKEEMKGKDVVFLYLTGETSPLDAFNKTYPAISGEHYRVSDAQWRSLCNTYNIQGIPTYLVFDRQGKLLDRYVSFPGINKLRVSINKGLNG